MRFQVIPSSIIVSWLANCFHGCFSGTNSERNVETTASALSKSFREDSERGYRQVDLSRWLSEFQEFRFIDIPIIPGSHNSASAKPRKKEDGPMYEMARQQELSIIDQLRSGVRLVDLRLRYQSGPVEAAREALHIDKDDDSGSHIRVSHDFDSSYKLEGVLKGIKQFIDANPTEFVLLMIRGDWPPEEKFSKPELKEDRVKEVADLLKSSGLAFVPRSALNPEKLKVSEIAGKVILISEWLQDDPIDNGDLLAENGIEYVSRTKSYKVCDLWNDMSPEDSAAKVSSFMEVSPDQVVNDNGDDCAKLALPGAALFTGVALDRTELATPPCMRSKRWTDWFANNLESNQNWRSNKNSGLPIGIVLVDFANPYLIKRLIDVGFKMAKKDKVKAIFPIDWFNGLDLHCSLKN